MLTVCAPTVKALNHANQCLFLLQASRKLLSDHFHAAGYSPVLASLPGFSAASSVAVLPKAICEFVTKKQFAERNPYDHIINTFLPKLSDGGIVCIADITTYNEVSNEWLTKMLDKASDACDVAILDRNKGYNEEFVVSHSFKRYDRSKIAWRLYKLNNSVS